MKIAYIGAKGLPSKGGAERVVEGIVTQLRDRHKLTVYCSSRFTPPETVIPGIRLIRVPCLDGKYTHMTTVNLMAAAHALAFGDYDLVHLHNMEASFILPLLRPRFPVVSTAHGRITPGNRWNNAVVTFLQTMELPFVYWSNLATSDSVIDADHLRTRCGRMVSYIPNGTDPDPPVDLDAARALLQDLGVAPGQYVIFAAGRLLPLKGAHILIEAFQRVHRDLRLIVVSDLSQVPAYAQQLRSLADERVVFVPPVPTLQQLLGLVKLSRLLVFPSLSEGMSMMLLEAATTGTPILCSDIPVNQTVLPDQALFFKSGDVQDLAQKLEWALDHTADLEGLGRRAQAWVRDHFTWEAVARQYETIYAHVARGASGRASARLGRTHTPPP